MGRTKTTKLTKMKISPVCWEVHNSGGIDGTHRQLFADTETARCLPFDEKVQIRTDAVLLRVQGRYAPSLSTFTAFRRSESGRMLVGDWQRPKRQTPQLFLQWKI